MKKVINDKPTFAELTALPPAELFALGSAIPKYNKAIVKAEETFENSLHVSAKTVAALKRLYTEQQNAKLIAPDLAFSSKKANKAGFFQQNCKGELPGRVDALSALFNQLVLTLDANGKPLLAEEFFDGAKVDWLEKANAIVSAAAKKHGDPAWKGCDDVLDTINALSGKPFLIGETAATLKEIRKRQKDTEAKTGAGEGAEGEDAENAKSKETVPLTLEVAVAFIKAQFSAAADVPKDRQVELCVALYEMNDAWGNNDMTENRHNELDNQIRHAREHGINPQIEVVTTHN
jgi:hypothetical protein